MYHFDNPEIIQIDNTLEDVFEECKVKYIQTSDYRCENDTEVDLNTSGEVFYSKVTSVFKLISSQSYRLLEKVGE